MRGVDIISSTGESEILIFLEVYNRLERNSSADTEFHGRPILSKCGKGNKQQEYEYMDEH